MTKNELVRRTKMGGGTIGKALSRFEKKGIVTLRRIGSKKYWELTPLCEKCSSILINVKRKRMFKCPRCGAVYHRR